jgi:D-cysteine desulfhydrase family pyridoxal phosphate-dependent enzyme
MITPQKLSIAHLPTPIEQYSRLRAGLWVKRDDFSGCELSGNKVRKLEYLVADALASGADTLITAGDVQSNHARATAIVAARLGMHSLLVLEGRSDETDWCKGNAFLDRFVGAEIDWQAQEGFTAPRMEKAADRLRSAGRKPYIIPVGGSNELGVWGYIDAAREAKQQCHTMGVRIDRVVCTTGSCGTHIGLLLGMKLANWAVRLTGIGISSTAEKKTAWARGLADRTIAKFNLPVNVDPHEIDIRDYAGAGYAKSRAEELSVIIDAARRGGLVLDPVYTGKAFYGMMDLVSRREIGADENILFFHTGGLLGLMAKPGLFADRVDFNLRAAGHSS